ncbi:MAG TPA: hypothetical protein VMH87_09410 [Pseudomonadales bacterium]|nr:hypothetical protein [Pseudomonadales bacterium]
MVPVKIECECGQNYAFDVEPANGSMPGSVACPSCGADGTAAANEFIAQQLAPKEIAPQSAPLAVAATTPIASGNSRRGTISREKAEEEARAKIMWGDSMEEVAAYLTVKGLNRSEAAEIAYKVSKERTAIVRRNGIWKIIAGIVMMCVPLLAYLLFEETGHLRVRRSLVCYGIGILGAYFFVTGILAVVAPKSEKGAVDKE